MKKIYLASPWFDKYQEEREETPMKPNRISLQTRIDRVSRGCYADPEYNLSMIAAMADLPLVDYLGGYDRERRELCLILGITAEEQETIP